MKQSSEQSCRSSNVRHPENYTRQHARTDERRRPLPRSYPRVLISQVPGVANKQTIENKIRIRTQLSALIADGPANPTERIK